VIEQHELKAALLASGQIEGDEATMQTVDNMIEWACTKAPNGDIDFEEYARIMRVKLDLAKQARPHLSPSLSSKPSPSPSPPPAFPHLVLTLALTLASPSPSPSPSPYPYPYP